MTSVKFWRSKGAQHFVARCWDRLTLENNIAADILLQHSPTLVFVQTCYVLDETGQLDATIERNMACHWPHVLLYNDCCVLSIKSAIFIVSTRSDMRMLKKICPVQSNSPVQRSSPIVQSSPCFLLCLNRVIRTWTKIIRT